MKSTFTLYCLLFLIDSNSKYVADTLIFASTTFMVLLIFAKAKLAYEQLVSNVSENVNS